MSKIHFAPVTDEELLELDPQMPIGYKAKIRCICGNVFDVPGLGHCPRCNAGMVVTASGNQFMPKAYVPQGSNLDGTNPPKLLEWVRE